MVKTDKFLEYKDTDLQLNLCRLPSNLGGITSKELNDLLEKNSVRRNKNNNYLRTKRDKCIALIENNIDNLNEKISIIERDIVSSPKVKSNKKQMTNLRGKTVKEIGEKIGDFKELIRTSLDNIKGSKDKIIQSVNKNEDLSKNLKQYKSTLKQIKSKPGYAEKSGEKLFSISDDIKSQQKTIKSSDSKFDKYSNRLDKIEKSLNIQNSKITSIADKFDNLKGDIKDGKHDDELKLKMELLKIEKDKSLILEVTKLVNDSKEQILDEIKSFQDGETNSLLLSLKKEVMDLGERNVQLKEEFEKLIDKENELRREKEGNLDITLDITKRLDELEKYNKEILSLLEEKKAKEEKLGKVKSRKKINKKEKDIITDLNEDLQIGKGKVRERALGKRRERFRGGNKVWSAGRKDRRRHHGDYQGRGDRRGARGFQMEQVLLRTEESDAKFQK